MISKVRQLSFILILLLTGVCSAGKIVEVQFRCNPPDAEVWIKNERLKWESLGHADRPLKFEAEKFSLYKFTAPGYEDREETIARQNFTAGIYPSSGELVLNPTVGTRLKSFLPPILGIGAILGILGVQARKKKAELKAQKERVAFLEGLQGEAKRTKDSALGQKLGKYLLTAFLGQGGMAVVYRGLAGKDHKTGEHVAVKVLSAVDDEQTIERFRREVQICQKLIHPNIVALHDWGEENELIYLAMELIEGGSLEDRLKDGLSYPEALRIFDEILAGMEFAHEQGVTHRDLKPDNVMLTDAGKVKITDFGLAKLQTIRTVTVSGAVMGTPAYMAPEQIQGGTPSPVMDQYALGVLGFELFTGRLPFEAEEMMALITKHLIEPAPSPKTVKEELPDELCEILLKMLEKEPDDRFAGLSEVRRALKSVPKTLKV